MNTSPFSSAPGILAENGRQFLRLWRGRGQNSTVQHWSVRQFVIPFVVLIAIIASAATLIDERSVIAMRGVSFTWQRIFAAITQIGWSGYLFAISGILAFAATFAARTGDTLQARAGLILLAHRAVLVFAVLATSGIAAQVLKHLVGRARPRLLAEFGPFHFDLFSIKASLASFPSGHTITVFATAWALALFLPRLRWPLYAVACLVGISRVVIGAHYPSDVFAGAAIGVFSAMLTAHAFARRQIALEFWEGGVRPRGRGLVIAALRALFQAGKARA